MPICPECNTGFDDEDHCPKCGAKSPLETWPRPSADTQTPTPEYGSFALFCLRLTQIFSFLSIIGAIVGFCTGLFKWDGFVSFLLTLIFIPISIGIFLALGIAIRFAEEKNGTREASPVDETEN